jgi:hypothetical protein
VCSFVRSSLPPVLPSFLPRYRDLLVALHQVFPTEIVLAVLIFFTEIVLNVLMFPTQIVLTVLIYPSSYYFDFSY